MMTMMTMMMMMAMMMMMMMRVTSSVVKKVLTATFSPLQLASHTSPYLRKIMLTIIIMILIDDVVHEDPLASHLCDDHDHDEGRSISPALSNSPLHLNLQQLILENHPIFSKRAFLFNKR